MSRLRLPARRRVQIDVSMAVVNIVLLLIFFFLAVGPGEHPEGQLDLSETRRLALDQLPSPILIVDPQGNWSLDGEPLTPELLPVALEGVGATEQLYLMIDREAPAGQLIAVLNRPELQSLDIELVTLHHEGGE